jgi:phage-related protein
VNGGNVATYPTLTIRGPVTDPVVRREDDGREMRFAIALGPTDVLVVDTQLRTVTLNGSTSRYSSLSSQSEWIDLPPGRSTVSWTAASYDPAAELGVAWRDAYL